MSGERDVVLPAYLQQGKAAFRELVHAYGGQDAAAEATGKSQSRICNYGLRNMADFAPTDVVVALEDHTHGMAGHPHVTRWQAKRQGFGLVKLPDPTGCPTDTRWGVFAARLAKEAGDVTSGICAGLADDNELSPAEAKALLREAGELMRVAVELEHALQTRAAEDRGG